MTTTRTALRTGAMALGFAFGLTGPACTPAGDENAGTATSTGETDETSDTLEPVEDGADTHGSDTAEAPEDTSGDTSGGATDEPPPEPEVAALEGEYIDDYGGYHFVRKDAWYQGQNTPRSVYTYDTIDNATSRLVAQNGSQNAYNPGKWSRFEWMTTGAGRLYMCQSVYDAASAQAATDAPPAGRSDPATTGCGSFPWSELLPQPLGLQGGFVDDYGGMHTIDATAWVTSGTPDSTYRIDAFSNYEQWIVAQNGAQNAYNPGKWSVFEWATDTAGDLYYCQSAYDAATEAAARMATRADRADLLGKGCGGFPWSTLSAP